MVKGTFFKECFRSIRGSFSRFLAIFLIVALGAGFLAGLLATTPDMRHTVSELYRETNLYDLRIAGNLGLEEADLQAIAAVDGVEAVMAAKSLDRELSLTSGDTLVGRFHAVTDWEGQDRALMNRSKLAEGRWPQSPDECVIEESEEIYQGALGIGQVLTLLPPEDDDPEDDEAPEEPFTQQQFTIVGIAASGTYVSMVQRGSTTLGNGTVGVIVYVQDDVIDTDYYTDIYAVVEGGHEAEAFTQTYDDLVAPVQQAVEALAETQKHVRADRLRRDAQEELDEAKQELADKTAEGEQELADALKELQDGEQEYADGLIELADGKQELLDGRQEIADALVDLREGEQELADALIELQDGELEYSDGLQEIADAEIEIADGQKELDDAYVEIQDAKRELKKALSILESGQQELDEGRAQLDAAQEQLDAGQAQLDAGKAQLTQQEAQLELGYQYGMVTPEEYQAGKVQIAAGKQYLDQQQAQLDAGKQALEDGRAELNAGGRELSKGWDEYEAGAEEVRQADIDYRWGLYKLQLAREELEEGKQELADARIELDDGWKEYNDGVADLKDGWAEYYDGLQELADAEIEIADAEVELADARIELDDGWKEYEDGKLEFDEKIYDANAKIRDAQDQIDDIDEPEWYVLTRGESNESYIFYDSDTQKVSAIAKVFPIFFFLVAALVASTTMTRMIDEDRGAIGTLKALGYSNAAIAGKYLLYASLACVAGAAVGLSVFLPLFPRVIAQAYALMYNLPPIQGGDHGVYILLSAGLILLAVLLSTLGALKSVLEDNAAALMRPKAPPAGKRILLERIRPLWSRMKFTHKVTARNLFRYKKRFFMTVIGIAGCTALLVAGFGLRDSISDIVQIQFTQLQNYNLTLSLEHEGDDVADRHIAAILADQNRITDHLTVHMESGEGFIPTRTTELGIVVTDDPAALTRFHTFRDRLTGQPVALTVRESFSPKRPQRC